MRAGRLPYASCIGSEKYLGPYAAGIWFSLTEKGRVALEKYSYGAEKTAPSAHCARGLFKGTLLEDGLVQLQLLAAAVVDVRAVSGEKGAGEAQSRVHAYLLQHDGGPVVPEGVAIKPAV